MTGESGAVSKVAGKGVFNLVVRNPCIDSDFVEIIHQPMLEIDYCLFDYPENKLSWSHAPYTVKTRPFEHTFCGETTHKAMFDDEDIDETSEPISYDAASRTFRLYSEDFDLIGD